MNSSLFLSRRNFLQHASASALGSSTLCSTMFNLQLTQMANAALTSETVATSKSLVCIFFNGGIDSFNLLIPTDEDRFETYQSVRGNLQINAGDLLDTDLNITTNQGTYALHPNASALAKMFSGDVDSNNNTIDKRLSFIGNVGTLIEPLTLNEFQDPTSGKKIPRALASHFDQARQWQTSLPQDSSSSSNLTGWAGRLTDFFNNCNIPDSGFQNVSFAGDSLFQRGINSRAFSINRNGLNNIGLSIARESRPDRDDINKLKNRLHNEVLDEAYRNFLEQSFTQISRESIESQLELKQASELLPDSDIPVTMPGTQIGQRLKETLKLIFGRVNNPSPDSPTTKRQIYFIDSEGWDMHSGLGNFGSMIRHVGEAISAFQRNLDLLGLADDVIGFTASDFARTLRSNGRGSDHAWGGPQFVFGKPIDAGKIIGSFPDQSPNSSLNIGRGGRFIPEYSTDEYYAELIKWFGIAEADLPTILPNYTNFTADATRTPLSFIA